jgi:hypothetical protein
MAGIAALAPPKEPANGFRLPVGINPFAKALAGATVLRLRQRTRQLPVTIVHSDALSISKQE